MEQKRSKKKLSSALPRPAARSRTSSAYSLRAERTRAKLIDAAVEEFSSEGFHETKISDIVSRAGLTQPTFYLYFKNKEALYDHLVDKVHDDLLEVIDRARLPAQLPGLAVRTNARNSIRAFLQYFVDHPKLARIGYFAPEAGARIRGKIAEVVARNIAFEQQHGYFRDDIDPVFAAHCYAGMVDQLIKNYIITASMDADALADAAAEVLLGGILPAADGPGRPQ
ncbi:hypothetical protein ASE00_07840 [Sphingomonas sp. Root710]|uniref:TetR/AcrR family transcriptional regulator n=1 Tax=Sphingomonas sp. Root710 TaxID=1736594 RepID=UPI0006F975E4|nr:TetR/AcrR family transcriptional regulator [Sphingomonas sp. Root710]KRB86590.1 hypothetical protein ASE00_07840 [Sphingomonas sp. Root710]